MGVLLQLILVILALIQCSTANTPHLRQIREAPPPSTPPIQNVTEINYRDLNKIVNDNSKTETLDSKKFVNNVHSYEELPLKLAKGKDEREINNAKNNETEKMENSKEDVKKDTTKLAKDKFRNDHSRAIDIDSSKFWSDDFHSKNVFTLPPTPDIEKFHESSDLSVERTWYPIFEASDELTTPKTHAFDQKFKETVESVEQNIDEHEHNDSDNKDEQDKDADLSVEDPVKKSESLDFAKAKVIVNNETIDKNSIHKDTNFEQTKKLSYETIFNDTKVYGDESTTKGETPRPSSTERNTTSTASILLTTPTTTKKDSLLKELFTEKSNTHILSNNIETETPTKPIKGIITSTTTSTTIRDREELKDIIMPTAATSVKIPENTPQSTTATTTTTITSIIMSTIATTTPGYIFLPKSNKLEQENHVIPINSSFESTLSSLDRPLSVENSTSLTLNNTDKKKHTVETRVAMDELTESTTTEISTSTDVPEITTFEATTIPLDELAFYEGTTVFIVENSTELSDSTTEFSSSTEEASTIETSTFESGHRTSKNLDKSIVTEQMVKISESTAENSTKIVDAATESTVRNELDSTTLNNERNVELKATNNTTQAVQDFEETTTMVLISTESDDEVTTLESTSEKILANITTTQKIVELSEATTEVNITVNTTEIVPEIRPTTTEIKTTNWEEKPTTTKYVFIHIENAGTNHTTLMPDVLSPNLNYSTIAAIDNEANKIRKGVLGDYSTSVTDRTYSSTTTSSTTTKTTSSTTLEPLVANISTTTEGNTETPTENSYSKDGGSGDKGKIAAIAISSVGAVCLVLLAGLLYVMKKRQKRLNYGPRCRPVSLDDYSIDNLSVYNSVRRKGGLRLSKRSFGNPAFEDPVAPTHPLNFTALAKFSTNYEDIKAEFEEIPQISARTSELPDGCETKNRYANVIPLPETRVYLKPIDGYPNSDYINANYVTGPKNVKGYYIATQGPMQNTVDDFWRMIWEQQAKVILMLTHLVENGLEKSVDYLPESQVIDCSRLFGDFQIVLKKQEVKDKYIISTLQLKNMVSNSWREVTHFWYLGWPEKGVPVEGNSLIAFLIEARSYMKTATIDKRDGLNGIQNGAAQNEHNPVVVHCSPGTGRTGVAMACDIAIREFETTRLVDIPKIVYRIRRDRAAAVQTKEQYMFIYKVVSLYATKLTGEALENF